MLEIDSLILRNFQSYGDYDTVISGLASLGPVLITGTIEAGDSNGAGKTTIPTAVLWCLTGRTFTKARPGDSVANWYTEGACFVEIRTVDGWVIRRSRRDSGHADLLVYDSTGTDQTRSTNDAAQKFINQKFKLDYNLLVTSTFFGQLTKSFLEASDTVRKDVLEKLLGLDRINAWAEVAREKLRGIEGRQELNRKTVENTNRDIAKFDGMISSNQAQMADFETGKQERLAELDAEVTTVEQLLESRVAQKPELDRMMLIYDKLSKLAENRNNFLTTISEIKPRVNQHQRNLDNLREEITKLEGYREKLAKTDYDGMRSAHRTNEELTRDHATLNQQVEELRLLIRSKRQDATKAAKTVKEWAELAGTICPTCKQDIDGTHVTDLCKPYRDEAKALVESIKDLEQQLSDLIVKRDAIVVQNVPYSMVELDRMEADFKASDERLRKRNEEVKAATVQLAADVDELGKAEATANKIKLAIEANRPSKTLAEIDSLCSSITGEEKRLARLRRELATKTAESNPYTKLGEQLAKSVGDLKQDLQRLDDELTVFSSKAVHYQYLWRSYSERSKVKRLILNKLIPYLNERIKYYLDCFGSDIQLTFKDNLSIESNVWGYDSCSGGERKRIDLSLMFALYDLYLGIHGRQCNIMVLDEVDGRLDGTGIEALINVIMNDFAGDEAARIKPGTIFVISHRPEMVDAFPTKIMVKRDEDRMSRIVEVQ